MFQLGGTTFVTLFTTFVPTLICLIVAGNVCVKLVGEDRMAAMARKCGKYAVLRYTLLPVLGVFFMTNPMAFSLGRYVDEKHKPALYDSTVSFVHPITGLFPHANASELFVFLGMASGISALGLSWGPLAIRYLIVAVIVMLLRGLVTEWITTARMKRETKSAAKEM